MHRDAQNFFKGLAYNKKIKIKQRQYAMDNIRANIYLDVINVYFMQV